MPATIFAGSKVKTLKDTLSLNGGADIISSSVNPTLVATSGLPGTILLNTSTGVVYRKLDSGNTTNWTDISAAASTPTGSVIDYAAKTIPAGYILASGLTIGSALSGATERANADTFNLFSLYWSDFTDLELPIFTSAGASSTRGVSAAADFSANKRLTIPDLRGRVLAGRDDMGGTAANRITTAASSINGLAVLGSGGTQTVTLGTSNIPTHGHSAGQLHARISISASNNAYQELSPATVTAWNSNRQLSGTSQSALTGLTTATTVAGTTDTSLTGSSTGSPVLNAQPTLIVNKIIKL